MTVQNDEFKSSLNPIELNSSVVRFDMKYGIIWSSWKLIITFILFKTKRPVETRVDHN